MKSFIRIVQVQGYYQEPNVYYDLFDIVNTLAKKDNLLIKNFSIIKEICTHQTTYAQVIFEEPFSLTDNDGVKFNHIWSEDFESDESEIEGW